MPMNHAHLLQPNKNLPLSEKLLNLPELSVLEVEHTSHEIRIYVEKRNKGECCPNCGHATNNHHSYRSKTRKIQDLPAYGKPTYLIITTERFDCSCGERGITETYGSISKGAQKTKRFERYLHENNHNNTFQGNARDNHVSTSSVFGRFKRFMRHQLKSCIETPYQGILPRILHIDDVSRKKGHKYMTALVDDAQKN